MSERTGKETVEMRNITKAVLGAAVAGALLLAAAGEARAQVPRTLNFQGRLTNAGGIPLTGPYQMTFSIWNATAGGASCFSDIQASVSVNAGLFNATIGSATAGGIATSCDFSQPYYLELSVSPDGPMSPRLALTPSAYAFSADRLGAYDSTAYKLQDPVTLDVTTTARVGVGVPSPVEALEVAGTLQGGTGLCIGANCRTAWPAGTVSSMSAGTGITASPSPITSTGSLAVNTTTFQSRVTGTCGTNAIRVIAANGTVTCTTIPTQKYCRWKSRTFTPGSKCRVPWGDGTGCSPGARGREATCEANGSWTVASITCVGDFTVCGL